MTRRRCCKIHLAPAAQRRAAHALFPTDLQARLAFTGPDFKDIKGLLHGGSTVGVLCADETEYVYPLTEVVRIKVYYEDKV